MTLALLLTAVGGAWAQTETLLTTITATGTDSYSETTPGVVTVTHDNDDFFGEYGWMWWSHAGSITVEAKDGYTITRCVFRQADKSATVTISTAPFKVKFVETHPFGDDYVKYICEGTNPNDDIDGFSTIEVYGYAAPAVPDVEVTTNAASEGATFTEATFAMPDFEATADYELVRDMGYKVAFSGVPTRARLAKDGNGKFHFADGLTFQLFDNIDAANPKDITSAEGITLMVGEVEALDFEGHTFYQLNKETLVPLADFLADAHLGTYVICAVASTGEYDGSFSSDMITLFQGYEVTVPAGEFVTYYKDEALYVEDEAAVLYTISSVNGDQAVLSDKSDAMPSNTPMLVYNNSNETKVILLIPCNEPDMAITVAPEFKGTLTGTTIAASTEAQTNYALNGKQFVYVKNAIEIGANKAYLSIPATVSNARALNIVFSDETTKITNTNLTNLTNDGWYDLNGRKLNGMPTKKGVYVKNGKKVVVK